jgi:hypothetical protein
MSKKRRSRFLDWSDAVLEFIIELFPFILRSMGRIIRHIFD